MNLKISQPEHSNSANSKSIPSKEEVENLVREAKSHEAEDKKRKEAVEQRNQLDNLIIQIEKTLSTNKEKLPIAEVNAVEKALEDAKLALKEHENNAEALKKASDDLMAASHKVAELLYKEAPGAEQGTSQAQAGTPEEPIDAEVTDKQ